MNTLLNATIVVAKDTCKKDNGPRQTYSSFFFFPKKAKISNEPNSKKHKNNKTHLIGKTSPKVLFSVGYWNAGRKCQPKEKAKPILGPGHTVFLLLSNGSN